MSIRIWTVFTALFAMTLFSPAASTFSPTASKLMKKLLTDYNKLAPPSRQVNLKFSLSLLQFEYNEAAFGVFWVKTTQLWSDSRLTWDPNLYEDIQSVRIPVELLWSPDIVNLLPSESTESSLTQALVYSNGSVVHVALSKMFRKCHPVIVSNKRRWTCLLELGSSAFDREQLNLTLDSRSGGLDIAEYMQNPLWVVVDTKVERVVTKRDCCPEQYIALQYWFSLVRGVENGEETLMAMPMALALLSPFVFLTQRKQKLRLTLAGLILTVFAVLSSLAAEAAQKTGIGMHSFFLGAIILMFVSFLLHLLPRYGDSVTRCLRRSSPPASSKSASSPPDESHEASLESANRQRPTGRVVNVNNDGSRQMDVLLGPAFDLASFAVSLLVTAVLIYQIQ